ncbi:MAG: tetraacyldisaccharide 4'-kinase [Synergistaceae bacterium]|nr:tetraacyldisaccharide 4'-kinase [Synergistaceae bacterium]
MNSYMTYVRGEKHNILLDCVFRPLSWVSSGVIAAMDFLRVHGLQKTTEPPLPLISVGNITYGGTNKTPFVEMLAKFAESRGVKAGIVTRGYSGRSHEVLVILGGNASREQAGDEPLMLSRELPEIPVAVAKNRIDGVKALRDSGAELVIADDAFQHRALGRDVNIVLIDSVCPFGNGMVIPAGIMREKIHALSRADIVVLTKSEQAHPENLASLRKTVMQYVPEGHIFTSRLESDGWLVFGSETPPESGAKVFTFSAIGSPESFTRYVQGMGLVITGQKSFRDHHRYSRADLENLCALAEESGAAFIMCTEKDLYNLPEKSQWPFTLPLAIPKVRAAVNESDRFFSLMTELLRPSVIVASNGYGEDAIGVILAQRLREKLPHSEICAFPLVGKGDAYLQAGFAAKSAPSITPSGGVLKYSLKDLWGDMRAGLLRHVREQLGDWQKIARRIRTPVCVGDVYLLLHTLLGSGARPMFCATAKTVYLSGHWRIERALINRFTIRTWTRDSKSAEQLGKNAVYSGSPIMDLLCDDVHEHKRGNVILLLPGSRIRACRDVKMLLDAAEILADEGESEFRMVLAPTLPVSEFLRACENFGWHCEKNTLTHDGITIALTNETVASAAEGVKILLGLGGTANQLCAGLGIPVISVDEKGKRVQKKLLGDSEILVRPEGKAIAECALRVLRDKRLYDSMSRAGRERMGRPGAVEDIAEYACDVLGWRVRERVYIKISAPQELTQGRPKN